MVHQTYKSWDLMSLSGFDNCGLHGPQGFISSPSMADCISGQNMQPTSLAFLWSHSLCRIVGDDENLPSLLTRVIGLLHLNPSGSLHAGGR